MSRTTLSGMIENASMAAAGPRDSRPTSQRACCERAGAEARARVTSGRQYRQAGARPARNCSQGCHSSSGSGSGRVNMKAARGHRSGGPSLVDSGGCRAQTHGLPAAPRGARCRLRSLGPAAAPSCRRTAATGPPWSCGGWGGGMQRTGRNGVFAGASRCTGSGDERREQCSCGENRGSEAHRGALKRAVVRLRSAGGGGAQCQCPAHPSPLPRPPRQQSSRAPSTHAFSSKGMSSSSSPAARFNTFASAW